MALLLDPNHRNRSKRTWAPINNKLMTIASALRFIRLCLG